MRAEAETVIRDVVAPAYTQAPHDDAQRVSAKGADDARGDHDARRRRLLPGDDREVHHAEPDGQADPRDRPERSRTHRGGDGGDEEEGGLQRARWRSSSTFLRTDPQFYAKTPRELLSYSAYVSKKADWKLAETIGFLPRRRHGIRPVPDALAPIYTGGRGGLEACLMNTYNLPARPLYTLAALTLHECTPGHSFQAALALEGPERPPFRRGTSFSGYGEGWGLYTEWLGTVMGIYETPYEDFGRLTYEMWRACRLVIDTGIHQFGWTREQAMDYLRTRAALSEHEITTEVERYIAWPGQALAYKLGELQIRRHRREAEEKLGAEVRSAAVPRRHPGDRLGAAAGARAAHGPVHRRRRRESARSAVVAGQSLARR